MSLRDAGDSVVKNSKLVAEAFKTDLHKNLPKQTEIHRESKQRRQLRVYCNKTRLRQVITPARWAYLLYFSRNTPSAMFFPKAKRCEANNGISLVFYLQ